MSGEVRVSCVTWNMAGKPAPEQIDPLVQSGCHIYALGFQESEANMRRFAVRLGEAVGADFELIRSVAMGQLWLGVWVHSSLLPEISCVIHGSVSTGLLGGAVKNKGGVAVSFFLRTTRLLFVNAHFQAHDHNCEKRNLDFARISSELFKPEQLRKLTPGSVPYVSPRSRLHPSQNSSEPSDSASVASRDSRMINGNMVEVPVPGAVSGTASQRAEEESSGDDETEEEEELAAGGAAAELRKRKSSSSNHNKNNKDLKAGQQSAASVTDTVSKTSTSESLEVQSAKTKSSRKPSPVIATRGRTPSIASTGSNPDGRQHHRTESTTSAVSASTSTSKRPSISAASQQQQQQQQPSINGTGVSLSGQVHYLHDRSFWFGDLNYRLAGNRKIVDRLVEDKSLEVMANIDQLHREKVHGRVFRGWHEGKITFMPTYKFDLGTKIYDTSQKRRVPSWTDRVLYHGFGIKELSYNSLQNILSSDHRPVFAIFEVTLRDNEETMLVPNPLYEDTGRLVDASLLPDPKSQQCKEKTVSPTVISQRSQTTEERSLIFHPQIHSINSNASGTSTKANSITYIPPPTSKACVIS